MKISIKRGTKEIGGSAVEVTADSGQRIIIDLGLPLDAEQNSIDLLPNIKGIQNKTADLLALLISHAHQDHYGLGKHIDQSIPIYLSKDADNIMRIAKEHHLPNAFIFENTYYFEDRKSFQIADFTITPYLFDHSAYGAYGFLIEADGQKIFYSGDFRAHGRKRRLFYKFLRAHPNNIDVLLMEGSCLGRENAEHYEYEEDLEKKFCDFWKDCTGLALVQTSAQNIDRIVTIYRAAKKSNRTLVLSGYAGHILWGINNSHIPNFTWNDVKKFSLKQHKSHEIDIDSILENPQKYVIAVDYRISQILKKYRAINDTTTYVYSMWSGYKEKYQDWLNFLEENDVKMQDIHTSGHADVPTLKKIATTLKPNCIIPIHTFFPQDFNRMFNNVICLNDGDVFDLSTKQIAGD